MDLEKIYHKMPILLQQLACNIEGWRTVRKNYGGKFKEFLKQAEERTYWSKEQIKEYRDMRLKLFIKHAYETVPYYRKLFNKINILPDDIKTLEDLACLPILTKRDVQDYGHELISSIIPKKEQILIKTSGTTGGAIHFPTTKQALQEQWAIWWRYRHWHGIQMGTWCAYFTGHVIVSLNQKSPPFWRYNYPGKKIHFSIFHLNHQNFPAYIEELRARRPPWIHGFPSVLSLLASYILDYRIDLGYQIKWITIGSENLMPHQIELIEKAFNIKPKQHYGMEEAVANISECECGSLHVDEDFAAVRFVPNSEGQGYKVIGTNFSNWATPLINYDVQDNVTLGEKLSCPCKRPGRIISSIDGRMEDYIILKDGTKLGRLVYTFAKFPNIREAQIYQKEYGEIIIRIVRGKDYKKEDEYKLIEELKVRLGDDMIIKIEYKKNLDRSSTGKLRFVINDIKEAKLF